MNMRTFPGLIFLAGRLQWLWACRACLETPLVMGNVESEVRKVWSLWCWICFWWPTMKWGQPHQPSGTSSSGTPEPLYISIYDSTFLSSSLWRKLCGVACCKREPIRAAMLTCRPQIRPSRRSVLSHSHWLYLTLPLEQLPDYWPLGKILVCVHSVHLFLDTHCS